MQNNRDDNNLGLHEVPGADHGFHTLDYVGAFSDGYFAGPETYVGHFLNDHLAAGALTATGRVFGGLFAGVHITSEYSKHGLVAAEKVAAEELTGLAGAEAGAVLGAIALSETGLGAIVGAIVGAIAGSLGGVAAMKSLIEALSGKELAPAHFGYQDVHLNAADLAELEREGMSPYEAKLALLDDMNRARDLYQEHQNREAIAAARADDRASVPGYSGPNPNHSGSPDDRDERSRQS
jgi:hypothetical protein